MAVLMGSVPPGLTFQDLVGGPTPRASLTSEHGRGTRAASRDWLMRIHLPDGVVREMTPTQYREFLVSYRFTRGTGSNAVARAAFVRPSRMAPGDQQGPRGRRRPLERE